MHSIHLFSLSSCIQTNILLPSPQINKKIVSLYLVITNSSNSQPNKIFNSNSVCNYEVYSETKFSAKVIHYFLYTISCL